MPDSSLFNKQKWENIPKWQYKYQMAIKYTNIAIKIPNGPEICTPKIIHSIA
jgi:hypothetical protein